jgi:hypothetical protein
MPQWALRGEVASHQGRGWMDGFRLRGGRQGATAPPAPPAMDYVPWNPDLMLSYAECSAHMLTGRWEPRAAYPWFGIPKACTDGLIMRQASNAGGLGRLARSHAPGRACPVMGAKEAQRQSSVLRCPARMAVPMIRIASAPSCAAVRRGTTYPSGRTTTSNATASTSGTAATCSRTWLQSALWLITRYQHACG